MIAAMSKLLSVRSRWSNEFDSGKKFASAMAPGDVRLVEDRNRRLRVLCNVRAVQGE